MTVRHHAFLLLICSLSLLLGGCASYATPGRGASLKSVYGGENLAGHEVPGNGSGPVAEGTDSAVQDKMKAKPLATFPASIAVARVQAPGYRSQTAVVHGRGAFVVVTSRDVETEDHFQRMNKLPMVRGIAPMNRLLLPEKFESDMDLRQAAASLHADMVLIYTLDTVFGIHDGMAPLSVVSLGLFPTQNVKVATTASAILVDTRSGYLYGTAESTSRKNQLAAAWTNSAAVDQLRLKTEAEAFDLLLGELENAWARVLVEHSKPLAVQPAP